jgi:hypothetical protein
VLVCFVAIVMAVVLLLLPSTCLCSAIARLTSASLALAEDLHFAILLTTAASLGTCEEKQRQTDQRTNRNPIGKKKESDKTTMHVRA